MKRLLLTSTLILYVTFTFSQIFYSEPTDIDVLESGLPIEAPFTGGFNNAQFSEIDLNQDGILDLIVTDRFRNQVKPYINGGSANSIDYTFAPEYASKFPEMNQILITQDYNNDGKMDLYVIGNNVFLYENTSTMNGGLSFRLIEKLLTKNNPPRTFEGPIGVNQTGINHPAFFDIDNDTDIDILHPSGSRQIDYHRNLSIDSNNNHVPLYERRNRCWGYLTFRFKAGFTSLDSILLQECGVNTRGERRKQPVQTTGSKHSEGKSLTAVDWDQNGSTDLIISDIASYQMKILLNSDSVNTVEKVNSEIYQINTPFPNAQNPVDLLFGTAYFIDVNNDGKKDLIVSSSHSNIDALGPYAKEEIWLYENTSQTNKNEFTLKTKTFLKDKTIDVGRNAKPVFIDYNKDGLMDLLVGTGGYLDENDSTFFADSLLLMKNIGTPAKPKFEIIDRNYLNLSSLDFGFQMRKLGNASPAVGDIDNDGDDDFLLVQRNKKLYLFEDTTVKSNDSEFKFHPEPFEKIKDALAADLFDINGDGKLDLITSNGVTITYYPNYGTKEIPKFNLELDSIIWTNGDTMRYFIEGNPDYSFFNVGDSLAVDNASNPNNTSRVVLLLTKIDSINNILECVNTIDFGVNGTQYDERNSEATLNFFNRNWEITRSDQTTENVFLFKDLGKTQFYAGGANSTTYRFNDFIEDFTPTYQDTSETPKIFMPVFSEYLFINGADINGDSITDLVVGLATGGIKILYGSRVNSINEIEDKVSAGSTFKIYPNPSNGIINLQLSEIGLKLENRLEIRDISGKLVLQQTLRSINHQIDVRSLSNGIYFVSVRNERGVQTEKLIIQP